MAAPAYFETPETAPVPETLSTTPVVAPLGAPETANEPLAAQVVNSLDDVNMDDATHMIRHEDLGADAGPGAVPKDLQPVAAAALARFRLWRDEIIAWFKTLASAAVYATLIVTFGFQVARVEGQSMAPTLEDQDRLIVNKLIYRLAEPRRGDIVMLYYPLNPDKSFVKRVIAEEGDTVRIVDGQVFVNDVPLSDEFIAEEFKSHDDYGPTVIPEGYAFVMGDHRNNSSDSRHWGFVPRKYIIGKVQVRWWPLPSSRVF